MPARPGLGEPLLELSAGRRCPPARRRLRRFTLLILILLLGRLELIFIAGLHPIGAIVPGDCLLEIGVGLVRSVTQLVEPSSHQAPGVVA